jgi:uncharacterized protein YbjT (DUF2867 family)
MSKKTALVIGANGLVGSELLKSLLVAPEYSKITVLVRKTLGIEASNLEEKIINFENLADYKESFKVDDVFCCLGTTIKKAKSQEAFKKVDVDYPLEMAKLSKEMDCKKFLVISSMGADPKSSVFYNRMKGTLEEGLQAMNLNSLQIFRPSLLLGNRKEFRFGEKVGSIIARGLIFLFVGALRKYRPIKAAKVADAMYKVAQMNENNFKIFMSQDIAEMI